MKIVNQVRQSGNQFFCLTSSQKHTQSGDEILATKWSVMHSCLSPRYSIISVEVPQFLYQKVAIYLYFPALNTTCIMHSAYILLHL